MAIGADSAIDFFGTQDEVTTSSAAVNNAAFSIASDTSEWTNDDDSKAVSVTLASAFASAPSAGATVDLYLQPMNVQSTNDNPAVDSNYKGKYVGSFLMDADATKHYVTIDIVLPNYKTSSSYTSYVYNNTGQQMSASWNLYFTPKTQGPHA